MNGKNVLQMPLGATAPRSSNKVGAQRPSPRFLGAVTPSWALTVLTLSCSFESMRFTKILSVAFVDTHNLFKFM